MKNVRISELIEKYGENVISIANTMRLSGKNYNEIIIETNISEDDIKLLFNIMELNISSNRLFKVKLDKDEIIKLYGEYKNIKKVSKHLNVSYEAMKHFLTENNINLIRKFKSKSQHVIDSRRNNKIKLIEYKGGCCEKCGYNKSVSVLQFHHLDQNEKDFTIGGRSYSYERLKKEVDKCILVCSNCHIEIHEELRNNK